MTTSNVLSSVSVGYRANFRDTAVTFRNSVTRSCTYPKDEEFFDALNDTVSYRVWDDKADVRFCEPCVVSNLRYIINASTGSTVTDVPNETICELMLRFADPRSANFGETFSLKLPRLSVPDFIVCMDRFIAARDKKWKANDQNVFCLWDWEIEDEQHPGCFGRWWHGEISSVVKNEGRWRGSPWNNLRITYSNQANESVTHCFWELFDAEDKVRWRRAAEAAASAIERAIVFSDPALSTKKSRERSLQKLRNSLRTIDSLRMLQTPLAMTSTFVKRLA